MVNPQPVPEAKIECKSHDGRVLAWVHIISEEVWKTNRWETAPLVKLDSKEARKVNEAEYQLRENGRYEYELERTEGISNSLRVQCACARRSASCKNHEDRGRIEVGSYCGLLQIEIINNVTSEIVATGAVEVRSVKLGYREEYRSMLDDIGKRLMDMLFDIRSPTQMALKSAWRDESRFLQQQIEFLRETVQSVAFRAAVQRVVTYPHRSTQAETTIRPIQKSGQVDRNISRQIVTKGPRHPLPETHPLYSHLTSIGVAQPSLPYHVTVLRKIDDLDTNDNRFIKHVLVTFRDFSSNAAKALRLNGKTWEIAASHADNVANDINQLLSQSFFRAITELRITQFGSPVLQQKSGYREIYQAWLRFEANSKLEWDATDDIFHAGKRNVAALYEYWLFFQLLDWFCSRFGGTKTAARQLVEWDGISRVKVRLKRGVQIGPFEGIFSGNQRRLKAQFYYNRRFAASLSHDESGSWTRTMQPDYTLSFWPADYTLAEAEQQELTVHIHFDAKYRVESLAALFGNTTEENLDSEIEESSSGNYKRVDLLKMHSYRDAVRRSEGAYILYPGNDNDRAQQWHPGNPKALEQNIKFGFHEILPGLGAFAITPDAAGRAKGVDQVSEFLDAVLDHLCNRATQREQRTYHVYETIRDGYEAPRISFPLHEKASNGLYRDIPPFQDLILVCWYEKDSIDWMLSQIPHRIVVRLGNRRGSLPIVKELAGTTHILLRSHNGETQPGLFRITSEVGQVLTRSELIKEGFPRVFGNPENIFAVFCAESDSNYHAWVWDGDKLLDAIEAFERRSNPDLAHISRTSPYPRMLSLADLIDAVKTRH